MDNGIKWRAMPADFPPWDRAYAFFRRWRDHSVVREFHDRLHGRVRERLGETRHRRPADLTRCRQDGRCRRRGQAGLRRRQADQAASGMSWSTRSVCCWA
ncbi:transposase [Streptomyces himalayensis]|uniref:transposase n=1 Tax=Streptomyces himalayensis TaxID=2820085 RepID=UPI0035A84875